LSVFCSKIDLKVMGMKSFTEQRIHKRFNVNNRSTVLTSPTIVLSYNVLDVSDTGLSFTYIGWEKWPQEGIKIDILDREYFLENIPAHIINDAQLNEKSKSLRRCSVEFGLLNEDQKYNLRRYIESVATN
jgi:hypothetical protein